MKKIIDIERLLTWAYRDELPKQDAGAWSAWNAIDQYSLLGVRIGSQIDYEARLPVILGPPHPDSLLIAKAIQGLPKPAGPLVIHHAIMGTTPNWCAQPITVHPIRDGSRVRIIGKCEAKNRYSPGSYCPLEYRPSLAQIEHARGEYAHWRAGLVSLVKNLVLKDHIASGPLAKPTPWLVDSPTKRVFYRLTTAVKAVAR